MLVDTDDNGRWSWQRLLNGFGCGHDGACICSNGFFSFFLLLICTIMVDEGGEFDNPLWYMID